MVLQKGEPESLILLLYILRRVTKIICIALTQKIIRQDQLRLVLYAFYGVVAFRKNIITWIDWIHRIYLPQHRNIQGENQGKNSLKLQKFYWLPKYSKYVPQFGLPLLLHCLSVCPHPHPMSCKLLYLMSHENFIITTFLLKK